MPSVRHLALCLLSAALPLAAQSGEPPLTITGYFQQSWPKQTETNRQIKEGINGALGTHFQTWEDVANLNIGVLALRTLSPNWKAGLEIDLSRGRIHGTEDVPDFGPGYGPGTVSFEQKYDLFADLLAIAQLRPFGETGRVVPYISGGAGVAYEKDTTTLGFASALGAGNFNLLKVENHGWFPMFTFGVGLDIYLNDRHDWFMEVAASYTWARLQHTVPATGLLPDLTGTTTVKADTDTTGPNVLIGFGCRF